MARNKVSKYQSIRVFYDTLIQCFPDGKHDDTLTPKGISKIKAKSIKD